MGSVVSSGSTGARATGNVTSESQTMSDASVIREKEESENVEEFHDTIDEDEARVRAKEEEMEEFRRQLKIKREQRREILDRHKSEKAELEKSLECERKAKLEAYEANKQLRELLLKNNIDIPDNLKSSKEDTNLSDTIMSMRDEFEQLKSNNNKLRRDLAETNHALQTAYSDITDLSAQNSECIKQINALKEVISVSKTMINLREQQLNDLKEKLNDIEKSLADREASMLSTDLRQEYERQLQNIRTLRGLYEERARLAEVTRQGLLRELEEQKRLKEAEVDKCKILTAKVQDLEEVVEELQEKIETKNNQIATCQDETRGIQAEMSVVNKLFSQVLLGYKTKQDLDKLVHRLEENHGLLTHMAERENGSEASSALPKLLLELVSQVDESEDNKETSPPSEVKSPNEDKSTESEAQSVVNTSAEEIVENLPKVWRVLMELLSHQTTTEENTSEKVTTCYKSVETKSGPVLVPSVSQTYIRLKDLIMEKLALIKEVNRMKQLNGHLETRLEEQERRLCLVTTELSKTWHVVGRLRRHHHQLHTHEKILKYELQQKRKLLNELKEELEYCREKWEQAREKNSQSERDLRKLRTEFSNRKTKSSGSFNHSAESGYSDERPSDDSSESNDESEYVTEPPMRSKKKLKKSFETILDSSTDFNLAAEREDPASDMLDVADLPLDTQDGDDHHDASVSDSCNSESLLKSEKICEETEDEIADIANDSCIEELSAETSNQSCIEIQSEKVVTDKLCEAGNKVKSEENINQPTSSTVSEIPLANVPNINPAAILNSIEQQYERLAKRNKKLEHLEKSGAALLKQTQTTANISKQIDSTLDHLINRPTSSRQNDVENLKTTLVDTQEVNTNPDSDKILVENSNDSQEEASSSINDSTNTSNGQDITQTLCGNAEPINAMESTPSIDFKGILDSIKQQNERLARKDERLSKLENDCSEVVQSISNTVCTGDEILEKLNTLHKDHQCDNSEENANIINNRIKEQNNSDSSRNSSEPSTSNEINHEAIFAARDLRLKRLEEQTKSLVNKVNDTTTKGVKIHYKLEELHNIYGSENSRSSTPCEENEESQDNERESPD